MMNKGDSCNADIQYFAGHVLKSTPMPQILCLLDRYECFTKHIKNTLLLMYVAPILYPRNDLKVLRKY